MIKGEPGAFDIGSKVRGELNKKGDVMKKNVSLLVSAAGWIAGLVEKLINALRERGVTDEQIHALVTENGSELIGEIADAIAEFVKRVKKIVYVISMDYAMSIEELVRLGKYDWINENITAKHFPTKRTGKAGIKIELVRFDRTISSEEALKEIDEMGYRAAEACELLTFGRYYPDVQREFPIVALGSFWQDDRGDRGVVCLYGGSGKRGDGIEWFGRDWNGDWRFAAVHK
jgi:hypothetical protein